MCSTPKSAVTLMSESPHTGRIPYISKKSWKKKVRRSGMRTVPGRVRPGELCGCWNTDCRACWSQEDEAALEESTRSRPVLPAAAGPWPILCFCTPYPRPPPQTRSLSSRLHLHLFASRLCIWGPWVPSSNCSSLCPVCAPLSGAPEWKPCSHPRSAMENPGPRFSTTSDSGLTFLGPRSWEQRSVEWRGTCE